MSVKKLALGLAVAIAAFCVTSSAFADVISGWHQNNNADPNAADGFGYRPSDFPQAADFGVGTHNIADFNPALNGAIYATVDSFSGTTNNDINGAGAGGSFSFIGDTNNGAKSVFAVPTTGYTDILVSWSQRGTSTGYTSRVFEYSTNGGGAWTNIGAYAGSAGVLSATFATVSLDLSAIAALENNPLAMFRITYSGATGATGNNRWDNFYVQGTLIPEPSTCALLFAGLIGCVTTRRKSL